MPAALKRLNFSLVQVLWVILSLQEPKKVEEEDVDWGDCAKLSFCVKCLGFINRRISFKRFGGFRSLDLLRIEIVKGHWYRVRPKVDFLKVYFVEHSQHLSLSMRTENISSMVIHRSWENFNSVTLSCKSNILYSPLLARAFFPVHRRLWLGCAKNNIILDQILLYRHQALCPSL